LHYPSISDKEMKILGLFVVVFSGLFISRALGYSDSAQLVGAVMGAGTYLLLQIK
jgi:hypothetical protein